MRKKFAFLVTRLRQRIHYEGLKNVNAKYSETDFIHIITKKQWVKYINNNFINKNHVKITRKKTRPAWDCRKMHFFNHKELKKRTFLCEVPMERDDWSLDV